MANDSTFKDKITQMLGMNADDEYDDVEVEEEYDVDDEEIGVGRVSSQSGLSGGADVLVLNPEVFEDAPIIVNKIKENKTVVVNLKNTEYEDGRKIFDFLNGAVFAVGGSIHKIAESVFILAPSEVSVSTDMEKESADFAQPILDWDAE